MACVETCTHERGGLSIVAHDAEIISLPVDQEKWRFTNAGSNNHLGHVAQSTGRVAHHLDNLGGASAN